MHIPSIRRKRAPHELVSEFGDRPLQLFGFDDICADHPVCLAVGTDSCPGAANDNLSQGWKDADTLQIGVVMNSVSMIDLVHSEFASDFIVRFLTILLSDGP